MVECMYPQNLTQSDVLRARWTTPEGKVLLQRLVPALWAGNEWSELLGELPGTSDVTDRRDLRGAPLTGRNLRGACLSGVTLDFADFSGADLTRAELNDSSGLWATFMTATLVEARMERVFFARAVLRGADLSRAVLIDAVLTGADLRNLRFVAADLTNAGLFGALLEGADFAKARLDGAQSGAFQPGPPGESE